MKKKDQLGKDQLGLSVLVIVLLASLAVVDFGSNYAQNHITGFTTADTADNIPSFNLGGGYNLISVTKNMKDKSVADVAGTCRGRLNSVWLSVDGTLVRVGMRAYTSASDKYEVIEKFGSNHLGLGMWINVDDNCKFNPSATAADTSNIPVKLTSGWNLIGVTQDMVGSGLEKLKQDAGCDIDVAWVYVNEKKAYRFVNPNVGELVDADVKAVRDLPPLKTFSSSDVGKGMWVHSSACTINAESARKPVASTGLEVKVLPSPETPTAGEQFTPTVVITNHDEKREDTAFTDLHLELKRAGQTVCRTDPSGYGMRFLMQLDNDESTSLWVSNVKSMNNVDPCFIQKTAPHEITVELTNVYKTETLKKVTVPYPEVTGTGTCNTHSDCQPGEFCSHATGGAAVCISTQIVQDALCTARAICE